MKYRKINWGFTFIEVVVVAGVVGVLSLAVVGVLFGSIKVSNKAIYLSRIDLEADWVLSSLRRQIIHADPKDDSTYGILNCNNICNPQLDVVSRLDGGKTTINCQNTGILGFVASTSAATTTTYPLNSKNVSVDCTSFCIVCSNTDGQSPSVNIGFTMSTSGGQAVAKNYSATFTLRY